MLVVAVAGVAFGGPTKGKIKPRITSEQIAEQQKPRVSGAGKEVGRDEALKAAHRKARESEGLISRSSILTSERNWTLVPKGALLHVPAAHRERVNAPRQGKLINWREFYAKNRTWLRLVSVTVDQASGENPLSEDYVASLRKTAQVVVAVCQGGPISVNIPKAGATGDGAKESSKPGRAGAQEEDPEARAAKEAEALKNLKRRVQQRSR